jgi:meso-butanediol dehydrogenase/(S,S)-butanediol dehydrogenase/diacetyl reductase
MDLMLRGKVAIVTGGASGIGTAIVSGFVEEGANVVIADINLNAAQNLAARMQKGAVRVLAHKTDVTKKSEVDNLISSALDTFGKIDILVNDAAICKIVKLVDLEEDEWDREIDINAKGVYLVTRAVAPHMIAARYGKIVNISSLAGKEGLAGETHYCASKFAVIGITQSVAKELAEYNINVNAVCPGMVRTPQWEGLLEDMCKYEGASKDEIFNRWVNQNLPLNRPQSPEDMANVVLFLASDISRNITGESVNVNGGWRMD